MMNNAFVKFGMGFEQFGLSYEQFKKDYQDEMEKIKNEKARLQDENNSLKQENSILSKRLQEIVVLLHHPLETAKTNSETSRRNSRKRPNRPTDSATSLCGREDDDTHSNHITHSKSALHHAKLLKRRRTIATAGSCLYSNEIACVDKKKSSHKSRRPLKLDTITHNAQNVCAMSPPSSIALPANKAPSATSAVAVSAAVGLPVGGGGGGEAPQWRRMGLHEHLLENAVNHRDLENYEPSVLFDSTTASTIRKPATTNSPADLDTSFDVSSILTNEMIALDAHQQHHPAHPKRHIQSANSSAKPTAFVAPKAQQKKTEIEEDLSLMYPAVPSALTGKKPEIAGGDAIAATAAATKMQAMEETEADSEILIDTANTQDGAKLPAVGGSPSDETKFKRPISVPVSKRTSNAAPPQPLQQAATTAAEGGRKLPNPKFCGECHKECSDSMQSALLFEKMSKCPHANKTAQKSRAALRCADQ